MAVDDRDAAARLAWQAAFASEVARLAGRASATTESGLPLQPLYTSADLVGFDVARDLGYPGQAPYTRGPYASMYRARPWTIRQVSGYGGGPEANERLRFLLHAGQTGLNIQLDTPTHVGLDADDPRARGEVGRVGVSLSTLDDLDALLRDLPLEQISVSYIATPVAPILLAMHVALAERRGVPLDRLSGSFQNDGLREHLLGEATGVFLPPRPTYKLALDVVEFCTQHVPRFNTATFNGYCVRSWGGNAVHELAIVLSLAKTYLRGAAERGLSVDAVASRLAFFLAVHRDFFEEVAKFRAARRLWARMLRDEFGTTSAAALRISVGTHGSVLTRQQPLNNAVRVAYHVLAAVLGGVQSIFATCYDEALGLPSEEAERLAINTQHIVAEEIGVTNVIDPLGGSYFVEALTNQLEQAAAALIAEIEARGGIFGAIESGWLRQRIGQRALAEYQAIERGERVYVGLNRYPSAEPETTERVWQPPYDTEAYEEQRRQELRAYKAGRDQARLAAALDNVRRCARAEANVVPALIAAVHVGATVGELSGVLKEVYGAYRAPLFVPAG